jgi:hypothetical protein
MQRRNFILGDATAWPVAADLKPATRETDGLLWSKSGPPPKDPLDTGRFRCNFI